jgi:phospholipase C
MQRSLRHTTVARFKSAGSHSSASSEARVSLSVTRLRLLVVAFCVLALAGCVGQVANTPPPPTPNQTVRFGHVFIVVEENANYADTIASPSMPYLNGLASQYGLATNYFANEHPSQPDYLELTAGQTFAPLSLTDSLTPHNFPIDADNVVRDLLAAGKTWKSYAENLPSVGYTGDDVGQYSVRHNPLAYFTDVQNDPNQAQNLVPFTQLSADLKNGNLPDYSFLVPNLCNDAHDCPLSTADAWLKANIDPLINSSQFQKDGLLIIVFDEANTLDFTSGGGHVAVVVVSPFSKRAYKSIAFYQHQSALRLLLEGLGVTKRPGDAATAPVMWEFFNAP